MRKAALNNGSQHFNEPVLISFEVCRVIGYAEDDEDCYLIIRHPRNGPSIDGNGPVSWCTFVGGYTYLTCLKEQNITVPKYPKYPGEIWTDYSRLDSFLEMNGVPKEEKFLIVLKNVERIELTQPS